MPANCADRNLLVGLLALQNGLINQAQLVAAFQEWSLEKGHALVDHLVSFGHLNDAQTAVVEALADLHVMKHGDVEQSLAAIPAGPSTRKRLAQLGDVDIERSLARQGLAATAVDEDSDLTANYSVGPATSDGQRFRVLRPHAHGGLGAVFVALDAELHREVALKQILDSHADEPTSRQRFVLEAEVTGGLEHPGIVPVYGMGTYGDGRPYYAMRFIRGGSLKEAIDRFHNDQALNRDLGRRSLELRKLLRRFSDVCNAIDYAHSRGVLHRDIKPGNIIVGKHGETLVVDWGLAKVTGRSDPVSGERALLPSSASGSAETLPGSALGTPAYMSPEQAEGNVEHLGPRSDVYSLGATLYYLLTGRPPVEGNVASVLRAVQQGDFKPPRHVDATIDGALEAVCQKAMARRPDDRYASPLALVEDVERWMADERVLAWREPLARRARRWAKRNRTAVTAAGVALLALVTGLSAVLAVQTKAKADVTKAFRREANANSALAAANAELTRSKMAVQARYELAVEAIKTFHTGVSEDFMMKQDRFKDLRNKLLMTASDFYGKLGALLREATDLPSRRALLTANFEVAGLAVRVGRQADALAMQSTVLASRQAMAREAGAMNEAGLDVTALQLDVAISHRALGGTADALGKRDEALSAYNAALAVLKPLAVAHPDRIEIQHEMAATQGDIALLLTEAHRPAEALAALESVLPIFEKLATAEPDNRRGPSTTVVSCTRVQDNSQTRSLRSSKRGNSMSDSFVITRTSEITERACNPVSRSSAKFCGAWASPQKLRPSTARRSRWLGSSSKTIPPLGIITAASKRLLTILSSCLPRQAKTSNARGRPIRRSLRSALPWRSWMGSRHLRLSTSLIWHVVRRCLPESAASPDRIYLTLSCAPGTIGQLTLCAGPSLPAIATSPACVPTPTSTGSGLGPISSS
jgi:eukaryotic-like serine/threonine-protein kinase